MATPELSYKDLEKKLQELERIISENRGVEKKLLESNKALNAREALLKSEERYRALFDNIPINTIVVDKEGRITAFRFPEHSEQIIKPGLGDLMYIDFAKYPGIDMRKELMDSIASGNHKEYLDLNYNDKFLHIRISPFRDGAIITAIDTTSVRKLECELQQALKRESIGTLAGGIAHEFNNILGVVIGNAELAMETIPDYNPALNCVKEILEASLRARDVVRQIMSFTRKTPVDKKPVQIITVIQDSLKQLSSTIPKGIIIEKKIICTSEVILGNATEISRVLMNLCKNSEHAMKGGVGVIEVGLEPILLDDQTASDYENLQAGRYVRLTVTDNGEGIDAKIMDRIFEPYFTTKDVGKGLGMGLAVVYGIVKKHDGAIKVKSELGKGTIVEALFPASPC